MILTSGILGRSTSQTVKQFCRQNDIGRSSYYRWAQQRRDEPAKRFGARVEQDLLQQINDRDLQISALRIAAEGNWFALNVVGNPCNQSKRNLDARSDLRAGH